MNASPLPCLRVFPGQRHQTVRHFGASACWWGPGDGLNPKIDPALRLLFTDEGLGLNNLRINIGGSVRDDRSDGQSACPERRNVYSPLREDGSYDIRRCAGSWAVLQKVMKLGTVTDITLFMNSPPSTMTKNGKTSSEKSGQEGVFISNLRDDCYEAYADYVAEVTERYIDAGVPVKYVSPINEPQWAWDGGQEGCHYAPEELERAMRLIVRAFEARKKQNPAMAQVRLSLPETAQWWQRPYVHDMYQLLATDPEFSGLDHFCAHSYGTTREQKENFARFVREIGGKLALHQSEYGGLHPEYDPTMEMGLELATVLYEDLTILHCESWSWWLGIGSFTYTDGLICSDDTMQTIGFPKRYYVMKQHSRYLKDCTCLTVGREEMPEEVLGSAFLTPDGRGMIWELVNTSAQAQRLRLAGLPLGASAAVIETSDTRSCEECGLFCADDALELSPRSVTTLIFNDIL